VRRNLRSSSAEASPEADEQRISTYLLQLREDEDEAPLEKPRNATGPECLGEQDGEDETQDDGVGLVRSIPPGLEEGHADADTRQLQGNGIGEGARDPANVVIDPVCDQDVPDGFPLDKKYAEKETSSLACSALATVLDAEWTNSDDELLLDGNLTEHEGLVRRKGLCSVKFRTAHLYSLLLDG